MGSNQGEGAGADCVGPPRTGHDCRQRGSVILPCTTGIHLGLIIVKREKKLYTWSLATLLQGQREDEKNNELLLLTGPHGCVSSFN